MKCFLSEFTDEFIIFIDVCEKTASTYKRALRQFFSYLADNTILSPQREDILNFRKHLEHSGHKPATTALYLSACRRFFNWTERSGIYPDIADGVKSPRQTHEHKRDFLAPSQLKTLLDGIDRDTSIGRRNFAIVALMAVGGLRTIEISRADIGDLRHIGGHTCLFIRGKGKSSKSDFVKVPSPVELAIHDYLDERPNRENNAPLFSSMSRRNMNGRLSTRTISKICKQAMLNTGFNSIRLTAHSLRHSAITLSLMAGIPIDDVSAFARHKSINTTMIYAHHIDRLKSICEDTVCNAIF